MSPRKSANKKTTAEDLHVGVMPHNIDVERLVLGSLLSAPESITEVLDLLRPEVFYDGRHAIIYEAMLDLFRQRLRIDIPMIESTLRRKGYLEEVGGVGYLVQLMEPVASTINLIAYAELLVEQYILRELIRFSGKTLQKARAQQTDTFELLSTTEQELFKIMEQTFRTRYQPIKDILPDFFSELEKAREHKEGLVGVPSGYVDIDRVTAGWQKSDLIILAARPGIGKTSFMLSMARNAALHYEVPLAIFSLEMSREQLVGRLISMEAQVKMPDIRSGRIDDYQMKKIQHAARKLEKSPIFIDDTPSLDPFELRAKARRLKAHHGVGLIMVDYLQLMQVHGERRSSFNREQEISTISRTLKAIAKELEVPVVALSQLNREVEKRGGKRPMLADLRESGAIEQDADLVLFIHRPAKAGLVPSEMDPAQARQYAEIIFAKNRHGETPIVPIRFIEEFATFAKWEALPTVDGNIEYRPSKLSDPDSSYNEADASNGEMPPF